jgi:hypothetical protein
MLNNNIIFVLIIILCFVIIYKKKELFTNSKNDLHVIICATHDNDDYQKLINSLKKYNFNYHTICWGKEWKGSGYGMRMQETLDYVKNIDKNDIILYLDGYDVINLGDINELIYKYINFNMDIVFAAEKGLWPDISLGYHNLIPNINQTYPYLNAQFIGKASTVKKMLEQAHKHLTADDQGEFWHYYLNNTDLCTLDYNCDIFQCLHDVDIDNDLEVNNNRIINKQFNSKPIFLHGNGTDGKYKLNKLYDLIEPLKK